MTYWSWCGWKASPACYALRSKPCRRISMTRRCHAACAKARSVNILPGLTDAELERTL